MASVAKPARRGTGRRRPHDRRTKAWRVRLTIPFADLGIAHPAPGWPSKPTSTGPAGRAVPGSRATWSPTNDPDYSDPNRSGAFVLRGKDRPGTKLKTRASK